MALNSQEQRSTFSSTKLNVNIRSMKNRRLISESLELKALESDITSSSKLSAGLPGHSYLPNDEIFVNIYSKEKSWCCSIETGIGINKKKKAHTSPLCSLPGTVLCQKYFWYQPAVILLHSS